jgi:hypothetical protein
MSVRRRASQQGSVMLPILITSAMGLAALLAAAWLIRFIAGSTIRSKGRTTLLSTAFVVAIAIGASIWSLASVYYATPASWIAAIGLSGLAVVILFGLVGADVGWRPLVAVALVGLSVVTFVLVLALGLNGVLPGSQPSTQLLDVRAAQIAQADGFTVLIPASQSFQTDGLPVDALPAPDKGVSLSYERFTIEERKAGTGQATGSLEDRLAAAFPGRPSKTNVTTPTVQGQPAVTAEFDFLPETGADFSRPTTEHGALVIFVSGRVEVRLMSRSGVRQNNGRSVRFSNLTAQELLGIAETLRPVR